jgi:2-dehydropantoate 2-reductase
MKKICIVGAGAIGGFIGTRLALLPDVAVSALARGATLAALRQHGWRMRSGADLLQAPARAEARAEALCVQDVVFIGPHTVVVPAMNGVPWWFCARVPGFEGVTLESVDPGGVVARSLPLAHVLGCVVHLSAAQAEPGVVQHQRGQGLIVGEAAGGTSARLQQLAALLRRAGFDATESADVRQDIWFKLWGNLTMNPVTALTGVTIDKLLADPLALAFCTAAMREAAALGAHIGCPISQTPEDRHGITAKLGAFKTSMLQDVEAGRGIELDAIVTVVHDIARRLQQPTPYIDAVLGLTRLFARERGLYPPA